MILLEYNVDCMHKATRKIETGSYRASTTSEKMFQKHILRWRLSRKIKLAETLVLYAFFYWVRSTEVSI